MGLLRVSDEWIPLQIKVFSKWVSCNLRGKSDSVVNDITKDLGDGVALIELAQILTGKKSPLRWSRKPKNNFGKTTNCDLALDMFKKDGVRIEPISGKDVCDNNEKLILGLVWTLILHYFIGQTVENKEMLMKWAFERTSGYRNISHFAPYDLSLCALLDSYVPEKIHYEQLDPKNTKYNSKLASNVMNELGIPVFLDPEDVEGQTKIDSKILLMELSSAMPILENLQSQNYQSNQEPTEILQVTERSVDISPQLINNDEEEDDEKVVVGQQFDGDNSQYAGKKFALIMTLNESDYNEGKKMETEGEVHLFGNDVDYAVTLEKDGKQFLNPAGAKLNLALPNENDVYQQFTFGKDNWNTVVDSFVRQGMVWDVADADNSNPPSGTPFYVFPFHGRHNQHFVFKNGRIYARQNGMVVTYVGGDVPFQMMPQSNHLKARQTFRIRLL